MAAELKSEYRFLKHCDHGLLRDQRGTAQFDMLQPEGRWHRIILDPFGESLSPVSPGNVHELAAARAFRVRAKPAG